MSENATPSFVLELEISFSDSLLNELYPVKRKGIPFFRPTGGREALDVRLAVGAAVYNAALGESLKRKDALVRDETYRLARASYAACKDKGVAVPEETKAMFAAAKFRVGYSEYAIHSYVKTVRRHFDGVLGIDECQKLASRAFRAVDETLAGKAKRVRFRHWRDDASVEGKSDRSTLKYVGHRCVQFGKNLVYPLVVKKGDSYAEEALTRRVKYVRLVRRAIRGKQRYFAQLVLEGCPPRTKNLRYGRKDSRVGIDLGTSTAAVVSSAEVSLNELAPETVVDEKALRRIQRAMDRSRRACNPGNYEADGAVKKGRLEWVDSNRYKRLAAERKEIFRRAAWKRKCSHNALANHVVSLGQDVRVENMNFAALAKRSKKTTVDGTNGRIRSKKRYGKTIMARAPASLVAAIERKLSYVGGSVRKVDAKVVKASQYDHKTGVCRKKRLDERWGYIGKERDKVQRDMYSAFLLMNVKAGVDEIDRSACVKRYRDFKKLHDEQVARLRKLEKKHVLRWYVA